MKSTTIAAVGALAMALVAAPPSLKSAQALSGLQAADIKASDVVEVRKRHFGGRKHFRGHKHFRAHKHFRGHKHFRRHGHVYLYPHVYYGGHSCGWLRHRALVTGSPYWWRRYYRCRHGWY